MRLTWQILFSLLIFCACSEKKSEYLKPEQMKEILVDINLAEGALKAKAFVGDTSKTLAPLIYHEIFEQHGVSKAVFMESLNHYLKNPKQLDKIYEDVIVELNKIQNGISK